MPDTLDPDAPTPEPADAVLAVRPPLSPEERALDAAAAAGDDLSPQEPT